MYVIEKKNIQCWWCGQVDAGLWKDMHCVKIAAYAYDIDIWLHLIW